MYACVYMYVSMCIYMNVTYVLCIFYEYYSVIKKKEILLFATTWIDLADILVSEITQTEKDNYYISVYIYIYTYIYVCIYVYMCLYIYAIYITT